MTCQHLVPPCCQIRGEPEPDLEARVPLQDGPAVAVPPDVPRPADGGGAGGGGVGAAQFRGERDKLGNYMYCTL